MMTIHDMKRHVSELLATRHSLGTELETSRGETSELRRECEVLRDDLQRLRTEIRKRLATDDAPPASRPDAEDARNRLAAERRSVGSLMHERDALIRQAREDRRRLGLALERARQLAESCRLAQLRRDAAREKLDEAVAAMASIRGFLVRSLEEESVEEEG